MHAQTPVMEAPTKTQAIPAGCRFPGELVSLLLVFAVF